jgi:hypothetical protein
MHNLADSVSLLGLADEVVVFIHVDQVAPEHTVRDLAGIDLLSRSGFFVGQMAKLDADWVSLVILNLGLVELERLGQDAALDLDGVLGVLLDVFEEEALNAALVGNNLLKTGQANNCVGNAIRAADGAGFVWVLETH